MAATKHSTYTLSADARDRLRSYLKGSDTELVASYLNAVEALIRGREWPIPFDTFYQSRASKKKELDRLRKAVHRLRQRIAPVDMVGELDIEQLGRKSGALAFDLYSTALGMARARSSTPDIDPAVVSCALNTIHDFHKNLIAIADLIDATDVALGETIRGDTPRASAECDVFDYNLIMHYWALFKSYPRIVKDKGFMLLVQYVYEASGLGIEASGDRIRKAVKKHRAVIAKT